MLGSHTPTSYRVDGLSARSRSVAVCHHVDMGGAQALTRRENFFGPRVNAGRAKAQRQKAEKHNRKTQQGGLAMRKVLVATCLALVTAVGAGGASANDQLNRMSQNPNEWVMQT